MIGVLVALAAIFSFGFGFWATKWIKQEVIRFLVAVGIAAVLMHGGLNLIVYILNS